MRSTKLSEFSGTLSILAVAVTVFGLQMDAQPLDSHMPRGVEWKAAAARNLAGQVIMSLKTAATMALPETPGSIITFDAPGACETRSLPACTVAVAINPAGAVLGYSVDSNGMPYGFIRDSSGRFNVFNVEGAIYYFDGLGSTLDAAGEATGSYWDANFSEHGFVRDGRGAITTFDAPGAVNGTAPVSINASGEITGVLLDVNFVFHGFFRDVHGNVTDFEPSDVGAACPNSPGTFPTAINAAGEIVGNYLDSGCNPHGFLRERNGAINVVDAPGFIGTFPLTINDGKVIAGWAIDSMGDRHWFVRDNRGSFTTFDTPDVSFVRSMDINPAGVIVGSYADSNSVFHSFRRASDGTLSAIDVSGGWTVAEGINPAGEITGSYADANGVVHGFLLLPQ